MSNYLGYTPESDAAYRKRARDIVHRLFNDVQDGQFMVFNGTYRGITGKWAVSVHPEWIHIPGRLFHSYDYQFKDRSFVGMILITTRAKEPSRVTEARFMHGTPVFEITPEQLEEYDVFYDFDAFPGGQETPIRNSHNTEEFRQALAAVEKLVHEMRNALPNAGDHSKSRNELLAQGQEKIDRLKDPNSTIRDASQIVAWLKGVMRSASQQIVVRYASDAVSSFYHWGQHIAWLLLG